MTLSVSKTVRAKRATKTRGRKTRRPWWVDAQVGDVYVNGKRLMGGPTLFELLAARREKEAKKNKAV